MNIAIAILAIALWAGARPAVATEPLAPPEPDAAQARDEPDLLSTGRAARLVPVTIIYTTYIKGHFRPYRFSEDVDADDDDPLFPGRDYGGMAAIAGYIRDARRQIEPQGGVVLVFDCGNTYIAGAEALHFRGRPMVEMMNRIGYDAAIPGNLDYNEGSPLLADLARQARFPFVTNHIFKADTGRPPEFLKSEAIINARGLKVGVTGVTHPTFDKMMKTSRIADLHIGHPQEMIGRSVRTLKSAGAELIVLLNHSHPGWISHYVDRAPDIHVAVNSAAESLKKATHVSESGMVFFFDKRYKRTVLSPWVDSHYTLGRIDFIFDRDSRTVHNPMSSLVYLMTDSVEPDTEVAALVEKYSRLYVEHAGARLREKIGHATGDFSMTRRPPDYSCSLGRLVTGALREKTGADIAYQNYGGIRRVLKQGPITVQNVLDILPFANYVVTGRVRGDNLAKLDVLFERGRHGAHRSGLEFEGKPGAISAIRVNGVPVEPDRYYTLVTSDFVLDQKILPHLEDAQVWDIKLQDALIDYIRKHKSISPDGKERETRFR